MSPRACPLEIGRLPCALNGNHLFAVSRYDDRTSLDELLTTLRVPGRRFRRTSGNGAVATLAPPPPPASNGTPAAPAPIDVERMAGVEEKLRQAADELRAADAVRTAVAERLVSHQLEGFGPATTTEAAPERRWLPLLVLGLLAAIGLGAAAATLLGDDAAPPAQPAPQARAAADLRPCSELPAGAAAAGPVTCTTGTSLTIAPAGEALDLPATGARVQDVTRSADGAVVRLSLRNGTTQAQSLDRRLYLSLGGERVYPASAPDVPAGATRSVSLRFPVDAATTGPVDLGIIPFSEAVDERPARLGVVRVTLPAG